MKKPRSRPSKALPPLCGQLGPGDGIDPKDEIRSSAPRQADRKTWQLCRQVRDTLRYLLTAETADDRLQGLDVVAVDPDPDASRLLVTVAPLDPAGSVDGSDVSARLMSRAGFFRAEVARAICRRKTPTLTFQFLPHPREQSEREGGAS